MLGKKIITILCSKILLNWSYGGFRLQCALVKNIMNSFKQCDKEQ